jgi:hypothetical protein
MIEWRQRAARHHRPRRLLRRMPSGWRAAAMNDDDKELV